MKQLGIAKMFAFGRGVNNKLSSRDGLSPYTQVSARLEMLGFKRGDSSFKSHCLSNIEVITKYAKGHFKKHATMEAKVKKPKPPQTVEPAKYVFVKSNEFLQGFEWRKLRMEALKKYKPICQCCGATPKSGGIMNVDHIKPRKLFPELALDIDNLQVLCGECNHGKGNWDMTDWRKSNEQ
jgi:hypothetical protein